MQDFASKISKNLLGVISAWRERATFPAGKRPGGRRQTYTLSYSWYLQFLNPINNLSLLMRSDENSTSRCKLKI
jgi:hypothetical protein